MHVIYVGFSGCWQDVESTEADAERGLASQVPNDAYRCGYCAVLCRSVLYCAVLCRAVPCCAVLCCAVLCFAALVCIVLVSGLNAVLCYLVPCCAVLCCFGEWLLYTFILSITRGEF